MLRDAAVKGRGIALLPTFIAGADLQQGALATILADYRPPRALALRDLSADPAPLGEGAVFIDFLVERFGRRPYWDLVD